MIRLRADPQGFLDGVRPPAILDEVQNVPEVFVLVRARIDREPRRTGRWLLNGSPRVYVADPGLACHLLGIDSADELARSRFLGAPFEGFIASEIAKAQLNAGRRRNPGGGAGRPGDRLAGASRRTRIAVVKRGEGVRHELR